MKKAFKLHLGFSQIELLITMIIFVLLILAAYPNYKDAILKARRAEARSALLSVMLQQERFYTQHNTYSAFIADSKNSLFKWWSGISAEKSYYEISAAPCPTQKLTQCVLLTATPGTKNVKPMEDLICGKLMLDSTHNKTYSNGTKPNPECW